MKLRIAHESDLPSLRIMGRCLCRAMLALEPKLVRMDEEVAFRCEAESLEKTFKTPGDFCLVAEAEGGLAGYANVHQKPNGDAHLESLYVEPAARGAGLGRGLLEAAKSEARRRGATHMTLKVLTDNRPAGALYEAQGFTENRRELWTAL